MKTIVCIPAFNEEKNIAQVIDKARKHASSVIVYDDGSVDNTYETARISGAEVIRGHKNKGYGNAVNALFRAAYERQADIVVTIDSDGQHDPDQIPSLIEPIMNGEADITIGSRFLEGSGSKRVPRYRAFGIKAITKITSAATYHHITDAQSGFRAYSRKALSVINLSQEGMAISTEILLRAREGNLRLVEVPISVSYDSGDTSTHNPVTHGLGVMINLIHLISFKHPLLFYGVPGLVFLIISAYFMSSALELFSTTRFVSTNMIIISLGIAIVGVILLTTGALVYTIVALLRGKTK